MEAEVSKLVVRLVRLYSQNERETDGAVHWKSMGPKLRQAFHKVGGHKFSDSDGFQHIYKGSNTTRFQYCKNSQYVLLYIRPIQGNTGGNVIAPELMGHVAIPTRWKEFLFHRGCSFDVTSILRSGLIAGGMESKEGRQTVFFTQMESLSEHRQLDQLGQSTRTKDCILGRQGLTPQLFTIQSLFHTFLIERQASQRKPFSWITEAVHRASMCEVAGKLPRRQLLDRAGLGRAQASSGPASHGRSAADGPRLQETFFS